MKLHPVCNLFPPMASDEFDSLVTDIRTYGVHTPIVTCDGLVIDGRHRLKACEIAGIECPSRTWEPGEGQSVVAYAISLNAKRRHLTPSQLAVVAVESLPLIEAESAARQKRGTLASTEAKVGRSSEIAGKALGISRASVNRAKAVKEASPEAFERIRTGETTVHAAHAEVKAKPSTPPPKRNLCEEGRTINDPVTAKALDARPEFDDLINALRALKRRVAALCNNTGGIRLNAQVLEADLKNAIGALAAARPHTPCVKVNCDRSCTLCKGTRYLTKLEWKYVPEELK